MNTQKIAKILKTAGLGLISELNSAIQVRALLVEAGMVFNDNPRVDVSKTKNGNRYRVHVGGHAPSVPSNIGSATPAKIARQFINAGCRDVRVERIETGETHLYHALGQRPMGQPAIFIEFYS